MKPKMNSPQLQLTRVYDAPVKKVWEAWTDPKMTALWWGPRGFTITTESKELKPGGKWVYTMHGPDGVDYPNITSYFVVEPYQRLEYDHGAHQNQKALFRVNVTFTEQNAQTTMQMTMTFESPEVAKTMSGFIKDAGGNATWDRLGEYLEKTCQGQDVFLLTRVFEAPLDVVFDMFTGASQIEKWQPPTGLEMKILSGEIAEGQNVFYEMGNAQMKFHGRSSYLSIKRPSYISFSQEFCDETGKRSKHPGAPVWPEQWLTSVSFTAEEPGVTRVTLRSQLLPKTSASETEAFLNERGGMTQGWSGSLDRLEELLVRQEA